MSWRIWKLTDKLRGLNFKIEEYRKMYYNLVQENKKLQNQIAKYQDLCYRIWENSEAIRDQLMRECEITLPDATPTWPEGIKPQPKAVKLTEDQMAHLEEMEGKWYD